LIEEGCVGNVKTGLGDEERALPRVEGVVQGGKEDGEDLKDLSVSPRVRSHGIRVDGLKRRRRWRWKEGDKGVDGRREKEAHSMGGIQGKHEKKSECEISRCIRKKEGR